MCFPLVAYSRHIQVFIKALSPIMTQRCAFWLLCAFMSAGVLSHQLTPNLWLHSSTSPPSPTHTTPGTRLTTEISHVETMTVLFISWPPLVFVFAWHSLACVHTHTNLKTQTTVSITVRGDKVGDGPGFSYLSVAADL